MVGTKSGNATESHVYIKQKKSKLITATKLGDSVLKVLYTTESKYLPNG
jgi:hypothetical protein